MLVFRLCSKDGLTPKSRHLTEASSQPVHPWGPVLELAVGVGCEQIRVLVGMCLSPSSFKQPGLKSRVLRQAGSRNAREGGMGLGQGCLPVPKTGHSFSLAGQVPYL